MKRRTPVYINILNVLVILIVVFYMFTQSSKFFFSEYFLGVALIAVIVTFIQHSIGDLIENEKFKKLTDEEKAAYIAETKIPYFKYLWNSAFKKQAETEEKDLIIDHGFDGIVELDNQLPKWWIGLFWFGTAYCILYMVSFAFTEFAHPDQEYDQEYKEQIAAYEEYIKTVPQANQETAKFSSDNIEEGKVIYETNCATCHGDKGQGGIGPNLTDNSWINIKEKNLFKNIFYIVDNGVPGTAMQAWGKNGVINGNDIEKVAAFVYHLNQELAPVTPAQGGAEPQGTVANWEK